jgi:UDP-2,3-diacylglucosamine pyrophosphatase LpxH
MRYFLRSVRSFLQWLLTRPVTFLANRFSSAPEQTAVFESLSRLLNLKNSKLLLELRMSLQKERFIVFSDHHKGGKNGADDFRTNESNYLKALAYYHREGFSLVQLGDCEELWENSIFTVIKQNRKTFEAEKKFIERNAFYKVFGNHDAFWQFDPLANFYLKEMYGEAIPTYEGLLLLPEGSPIRLFLTHGHQGDKSSDGNWLSAAFVTYVWGPLQALLSINTNTPSANTQLKSLHNRYMQQWGAAQPDLLLITGHTHQPVFESLTHLERLLMQLNEAKAIGNEETITRINAEIPRRKREYDVVQPDFANMSPSYFNTGCCCFNNGTITGIEIENSCIRLIKWNRAGDVVQRHVLQEAAIADLAVKLKRKPSA